MADPKREPLLKHKEIELQDKRNRNVTLTSTLSHIRARGNTVIKKLSNKGLTYKLFPRFFESRVLEEMEELDKEQSLELLGENFFIEGTLSSRTKWLFAFKMIMGTGLFYVPQAFSKGGWFFSSIWTIGLSALVALNLYWLAIARQQNWRPVSELTRLIFGKYGSHALTALLICCSCSVYIINTMLFIDAIKRVVTFYGYEISIMTSAFMHYILLCPVILLKRMVELTLHGLQMAVIIFVLIIFKLTWYLPRLSGDENIESVRPPSFVIVMGVTFYIFGEAFRYFPRRLTNEGTEVKPNTLIRSNIALVLIVLVLGFLGLFVTDCGTDSNILEEISMSPFNSACFIVILATLLIRYPYNLFPFTVRLDMWFDNNIQDLFLCIFKLTISVVLNFVAVALINHSQEFFSAAGCLFFSPVLLVFPSLINLNVNQPSVTGQVLSYCSIAVSVCSAIWCLFNHLIV